MTTSPPVVPAAASTAPVLTIAQYPKRPSTATTGALGVREMHINNRIWAGVGRIDRKRLVLAIATVSVINVLVDVSNSLVLRVSIGLVLVTLTNLYKLGEYTAMCEGPHPYIPAINTAKVELVYSVLGEICENVLHFTAVTPWDATSLLQLCADVKTAWNDNVKANLSTSASLEKIRATDLATATGASVEYTTGLPITGTIGNAVTNTMQTVVTKLTTDGRGRSRRGRIYNIGIPDNAVTNNQITTTYAGQLTTAWNDFRSDILASTSAAPLTIVSYCQNKFWLAEAEAYAVTGASTDIYVDSQRRRGHGRGM